MVARVVGILALAAVGALPAASGDWPQYRGPAGDGTAAGHGVFAGEPAIVLEPAWTTAIGSGYSGLAIGGGKVVTMFSDGAADVMAAFDAQDGHERWRFTIEPTYAGHDGSHDGPLATPAIVGDAVIGLGARGRFFALELETGRPLWSRDLASELNAPAPHYGFATSPITIAGFPGVVILQPGGTGGTVAGFAAATGELLWSAGDDRVAAQTPAPWTFDGGTQVVASGAKEVFGVDPATGNLLWRFRHDGGGGRGSASMTPVPAGAGRILLTHKDDASMLVEVARDEDVDPGSDGRRGSFRVTAGWEERALRNSYNVPLIHDGRIYAFSSRVLTALDAATGIPAWRSRAPGDGFLIAVDDQLVILTKAGSLHVAPADSAGYHERAGVELFDDVAWTHPAFADGAIFARSLGALTRVEVRRGDRPSRVASDDRNAMAGTRFAAFLEEARRAPSPQAVVNQLLRDAGDTPLVEDDWVHFVYRSHGDDVAVAGDMFGARQERPMERLVGSDLFHYSMRLAPDARLDYLFVDEYEQTTDPLNGRRTTTSVVGHDMELVPGGTMEMSWFAMPQWRAPDHLRPAPADRRGTLESFERESTALGRNVGVTVYLPAGYAADDRRYPVVYVHDGAAARRSGDWPNSLDNLLGSRVRPLIAVFIETRTGRDLDDYAAMVADELVPWADATFRTVAEPATRAHVGAGRGAYAAFYCTFRRPGIAGHVGAQSLYMFDSNRAILAPWVGAAGEPPLDVYLEWGKYDLRNPQEAWDIGRFSREFFEFLQSRGYAPAGGAVRDGTGWSSWRNRTDVVLEALFPLAERSQSE